MPGTVTIPIDGVFQRTGVVVHQADPQQHPVRPGQDFPADQYGVLIEWPTALDGASLTWLHLGARYVEGGRATGFGADEPAAQEVFRAHKVVGTKLAQKTAEAIRQGQAAYLIGSATVRGDVRLTVVVDTSADGFLKFAARPTAAGGDAPALTVTATVTFFHLPPGAAKPYTDDLAVRLVFRPGTAAAEDKAFAALDLGNTASAVAVLPEVGAGDLRCLTTAPLPADGGRADQVYGALSAAPAAVPSEVRITKVRSRQADYPGGPPDTRQFPKRAPGGGFAPSCDLSEPAAVTWLAGAVAQRTGAAGGLILGAKRRAATRDLGAAIRVTVEHRYVPAVGDTQIRSKDFVDFDARLPLELLAARLLQHLTEDTRRWPSRLALTYPTTYTRHELQQLRQAVHRGWLRAVGASLRAGDPFDTTDLDLAARVRDVQQLVNAGPDLEAQETDPLIALALDEASAAGFFFLHRRIFDQMDGGLVGFSYVYPTGLNLLLYDCGGGTTDVCLLNARVRDDYKALRVRVLKRGGVRDFGGDDITWEVCRLLKARLAAAVAKVKATGRPLPPWPDTPPGTDRAAVLNKYIAGVAAADPDDELVPTKQLPGQPSFVRRQQALGLWRWGEALKSDLRDKEDVLLGPVDREKNDLTTALFAQVGQQAQGLRSEIEKLKIRRADVDALIRDRARQSVAVCNQIIEQAFRTGDRADEVHWVVASGNAVQYPFLQELLKTELRVPELTGPGGRFEFDAANAKAAVAKGAVLALATQETANIALEFDWDLAGRLPCDIGYEDLSVKQKFTLYPEHTHYRELKAMQPKGVPIAAVTGAAGPGGAAGPTKQFTLFRRFSGDPDFAPFLQFTFSAGIRGDLTVQYDDTSAYEFIVTDAGGQVGVPTDLTAGNVYTAPAERGTL